MNKIFKVIWNHTTQSWVAVSELTSAKGKTKSKTAAKLTALSLVAGSALVAGNAMAATAATDTNNNAISYISINSSNGTSATASGTDAIAQGNNAKAQGVSSIAIGKDSLSGVDGKDSEKNIAIGDHATAASNEAIAIGAGAEVASVDPSRINARGIAIGSQARVAATRDNTGTNSSTDSISIGTRSWASATNSIVIGADATSLRNPDSTYPQSAENTVAIGVNSSADWLGSSAFGYNSRANSAYGVAIGANASSSPSNATTLNNAGGTAMTLGSVAIGNAANSFGQAGTAVGVATIANGPGSTATGYGATAMSQTGTSVGYGSYTSKSQDVAIGVSAQTGAVDQGRQTAIGNAAISTTTAGTAIGSRAVSNGIRSTAIGAVSNAYGQSAISIGSSSGSDASSIGPLSSGTNATTLGTNATAIGTSTLAIGTEAKAGVSSANVTTARTAYNTYTNAYRTYAALQQATQKATAANNMAQSNAAALAKNLKIALTGLSSAATAQLTAAGVTADEISALTDAINNTDYSTNSNNAAAAVTNKEIINKIAAIANTSAGETNEKLAYLVAIAKDLQAKTTTYETTTTALATATEAEAAGKTVYDTAKSTYDAAITALSAQANATAIGNGAVASGADSIAQGTSAQATATRAIAVGTSAQATAENAMAQGYNSKATAASAIAQGSSANASAANAIAQGNSAAASGDSAVATGSNSSSSGQYSVAVGRQSTASNSQATAVGYGSIASGNSDAAYGAGAVASGGFGVAVGVQSKASAQMGVAVGMAASASGLASAALGPGASATVERGVALGNRSEANTAARQGFNPASQSVSLTGVSNGADDTRLNTYAGLTGNTLTSTLAAVSVGSSTNTRQINHVAAGTADDDAVNVAQLRSVNLKIAGNTSGQTDSAKGENYDSSTATSKDNVLLDSQTLKVVSSNTDLLTTDATDNTITITANAQKIVEAAQLPVVYTTADGTKLQKVGDSFYPADAVVSSNGNVYPAGTTLDSDGNPTDTNVTALTATPAADVIASMNNAGNSTTTAMALSNVGAGANTIAYADDGSELVKVGDAYYTTDQFENGKLKSGATATTAPTATPTDAVKAAKSGLADLTNSNPTNALTVADARNMGWVVSTDHTLTAKDGTSTSGTAYASAVKNANEVHFQGTGIATVSGGTIDGVQTINVNVDAQKVTDSAQLPVVYTDKAGNKLIKVGDNFYPAGSVVSSNGNVYPAGTELDSDGNPTDTSVTALTATPAADVIASMNNAGNSTTTAMALSNVGAGANTIAYANDGTAIVKVGDAYYTTDQFENGKLKSGATATTAPTADPTDAVKAAKAGLADLTNSNPTNALTVADARNMGWVVSANNTLTDATNGTSNTTAYADSVKNANEVRFTGTGIATVSGKTDDNGVRTINVHVDAQSVSESAQNPVVYTTADGTKLTKVGDNFYPAGSVVSSNGNVYPAGTTLGTDGNPTDSSVTALTATPVANVIASMNNAGNSTTTPMALSNVGAGANTIAYDADGNQLVNIDGKYYSSSDVTNGQPNEGATAKTAVTPDSTEKPVEAAKTGLADLDNSNETNALTVADAKNLGWVVEASNTGSDGKDATNYAGAVKNSNEVRFNGSNGITVTGKTGDNGEHIIDIALAKGTVVSTDQAGKTGTTTDAAGNTVNVIKIGDNWYNAGDVTTDENGNNIAKEGATPITTNVTANTSGSGFVTGNQVGDAIEQSGWNLGKATDATMQAATGTGLTAENGNVEKVNPNDNVRYVDGTNITQTLKTVTETNADGTTHTTTYIKADLNPQVTLGGKEANADGSLTVNDKDGNTGVSIAANNGAGTVNINGSDGSKAAIGVVKAPTNLANMPAGAVNVDGKWYNPSDVTTTTDAAGNTTTTVNAGATPISATMDRIQYTDANGTPHQVATMEDGLKFRGDDGQSISKPLNSTVELTGGNRTTTNADGSTTSAPVAKAATTTGNIGVFNDNGKMSVQLAKDLQGMNSATFGGDNNSAQTVINGNGVTVNPAGNTDPANTVSVTTNGVNAGNQRVTNVAPGRIAADSKDAVNGSQLYGVAQNVNNLGNKINRMDKDLRAGVAGANAAAGLPQVYLPGKSMVAASAGTFKGQNAVAIGYSRASDNGKVIFKLQGNANSQGDVGGSVGVGYQW